ncbi:class I SAM-dependent methyltransferase [Desulfuromonas sp. AOP6]|uniref:class I SAM-dependent methyltransferase n=1 Tax=Desulfuromonas sp. AOP6 TaxID=1566351 RepID=UPI0012848A35|nr:class I SAM-dependent methyltransferase [Desulfuromonas sp. AOP6]BCA80497.1 methyltransferase type 11 [Desulfuromonas sp. AOP6]
MSENNPRFMALFLDLFESLPRQGPGSPACAERALRLCRELPPVPRILDLGCGTGAQTLYLAELTAGTILAIDSHAPSIERLQETLAERGLSRRVKARVGDMAQLELPPASFDLIWSEGALYNIGMERALPICFEFLRPGGYLAFTDAVWRQGNPPEEVRNAFEKEGATLGWAAEVAAAIAKGGFELLDHFTLPYEAWWDDFYTPMLARIEAMRHQYANDREALTILDEIAREPEMHRHYADYYGYEFFVARRP